MNVVENAYVASPEVLHHRADGTFLRWRYKKVHMIRHEDVRVQ